MLDTARVFMDHTAEGGSLYSFGLALSGGGFRGLAHIGVLRTLERYGFAPDFIAGTSAGSLIGALYAAGKSADQIEAIAFEVFWPGLLRSQGIRKFCSKYLPSKFEDLKSPLHVAATELPSWKTYVFSSGDLRVGFSRQLRDTLFSSSCSHRREQLYRRWLGQRASLCDLPREFVPGGHRLRRMVT